MNECKPRIDGELEHDAGTGEEDAGSGGQGLTLVHFMAQRKHIFGDTWGA